MAGGRPKFFRKVINGDRAQTQLQTNIEQAVANSIKNPLMDGRLLTKVSLIVGTNMLEHKLGRVPQGYFICSQNNTATITDNLLTEPRADLYLPLVVSAPCTVTLWVF